MEAKGKASIEGKILHWSMEIHVFLVNSEEENFWLCFSKKMKLTKYYKKKVTGIFDELESDGFSQRENIVLINEYLCFLSYFIVEGNDC